MPTSSSSNPRDGAARTYRGHDAQNYIRNLALYAATMHTAASGRAIRWEGEMKSAPAMLIAAAGALWAPAAAATTLTVVNVNAPAVNCVFNATCKVVVNDSTGSLPNSPYGGGAFLQSRTYSGQPGTPGAGLTAYEYRVALNQGTGFTECLGGVVINFGPVKKLTYPNNQPAHVYVVTTGGLGSVGIESAELDGDVITFTFKGYLCAGQTSFFFGLASATLPHATNATLFAFGNPPIIQTDARAPTH
jgi:hypothetical protein